tara:strand:+ start:323 stop:655 length:333 start_codon:yes stop_codon:yes gene_type:complete
MNLSDQVHDFPHSPPDGYSYQVEKHNASTIAIWLLHHRRYVFSDDDQPVRTIWGFVKTKRGRKGSIKKTYHAPINSNKIGKEVDVKNTTPYTSMQLNLTPLELAYVQTKG